MTFKEMNAKFSEIVSKGKSVGLTIDDYTLLERMRDDLLISLRKLYVRRDYLNNEFFSAVEEMYKKGMSGVLSYDDYVLFKEKTARLDSKITSYFSVFSEEIPGEDEQILFGNMDDVIRSIDYNQLITGLSAKELRYIRQNSFLLPLVLANNTHPKIKMYGDNSYMFLCQFHVERTPSLGVSDIKNLMHCFACHTNGSAIDYLMKYENLSFKDAVQLLSQIYKFDIKRSDAQLDGLVEKYQNAILSDQYLELLEKGQDRLRRRGIEQFDGKSVDAVYDYRYHTIDRIRNGENDPNFICDGPKQLIYLNNKKGL